MLQIGLDHAVVEVGGVGLAVHATPGTLAGLRRGAAGRLATTLVVREDSLTLFGFADDAERELFGLLQSVAGIGPRIALAMLAVLDPDTLRRALAEGDVKTLDPGAGHRAQGAPSGWCWSSRTRSAPRPRPARPAAAARNGDEPAPRQVVRGAGRTRVHGQAGGGAVDDALDRERRRRRQHPAARRPRHPGPLPMTPPRRWAGLRTLDPR